MVFTAIAYNAGRVNTEGSFKQGFKSDDGRYYGENIWRYLQLAKILPPWVPPEVKPAAVTVETTPGGSPSSDGQPSGSQPQQPPLTS
jgi:hypothetical protein